MKRMYLAVIVMTMAGSAVFARGSMESDPRAGFDDRKGPGNNGNAITAGEVEALTGTILEQDGKVVLDTAEGRYTLSVSGFRRNPVEIPFGETVTVSGTAVACDGADCPEEGCDIDAAGHIFVSSAESGSERYDFNNESGRGGRNQNNGNGRGAATSRTSGNRQPHGGQDERQNGGRGYGRRDGSTIEDTE